MINPDLAVEEHILKSDSHFPKKTCFVFFNEIPLKLMKSGLYFISNAFSVLNPSRPVHLRNLY